jgi:hypothetical protein
MTAVLLQLAPALALLLALVLGRYPGERSLDELRRRTTRRAPAGRARAAQRWRPRHAAVHHRGLWLATPFSARPPPAG